MTRPARAQPSRRRQSRRRSAYLRYLKTAESMALPGSGFASGGKSGSPQYQFYLNPPVEEP